MTEPSEALKPCPWCGHNLVKSRGALNPYAVCVTEDCWLADRRISIPLDDPKQVASFNTRAMGAGEPVARVNPRDAAKDALTRFPAIMATLDHPSPTAATDVAELVAAASAVLSWWPDGSETVSRAGKIRGTAFAADIRALRALLARLGRVEG